MKSSCTLTCSDFRAGDATGFVQVLIDLYRDNRGWFLQVLLNPGWCRGLRWGPQRCRREASLWKTKSRSVGQRVTNPSFMLVATVLHLLVALFDR